MESSTFTLSALLPPVIQTDRLALERFTEAPEQYACSLAAINSPTALREMGDYGLHTPADLYALNLATRLSPSLIGGRIVDTDFHYLLRLRDGRASGPVSAALLRKDGSWSSGSAEVRDDEGSTTVRPSPLMGTISLVQRSHSLPPDMGWCLLEAYHGHGYATEAASAVLHFIRTTLGIKDVMAWPGTKNKASIAVATKIGMVEAGFIIDEHGEEDLVYAMPGMKRMDGVRMNFGGDDGKK